MDKLKIYVIRHGETDWNVDRRLQGMSDIPLNDYGIELAKITSEGLKDIPFDVIYTSPLLRAKETARIVCGDRQIPVIEDERIREMCFGVFEGLSCSKDHYEIPDPDFVNFFKDPAAYNPPEGGESFEQLCERTTNFLNDIVKNHDPAHKTILVSTHGAALKGLLSSFTITDIGEFWQGGVHKNCGVSLVNYEAGVFSLEWENKIFYEDTKARAFFEE